jgi:hypothetical protein
MIEAIMPLVTACDYSRPDLRGGKTMLTNKKAKQFLASTAMLSGVFFGATSANAVSLYPTNNIVDLNLADSTPSNTYDVATGPFTWGASFVNADAAGTATFNFVNNGATGTTVNLFGTVLQAFGTFLGTGVTISWIGGPSDNVTSGTLVDTFSLTTFLAAGQTQTLQIVYGNPSGPVGAFPSINFQVSAVPVPPALLLFVSGLAGLGAISRRRRKVGAI